MSDEDGRARAREDAYIRFICEADWQPMPGPLYWIDGGARIQQIHDDRRAVEALIREVQDGE